MADNFDITEGSGRTIAADEVGGALHQYVKPCFGADGTATIVSTSNPLPVGGSGAAALGKAEDAGHTTGDVGVPAMAVVTTDNDGTTVTDGDYAMLTANVQGALRVQNTMNVSGGASVHRDTDIDETESTVKASAGMVYGGQLWNVSTTAAAFLHFYDAASPDTATDTPLASFCVPKGAAGIPGMLNLSEALAGCPIPFATAITVGALTTMAPGAVGPGASEVQGSILYK